MSLKQFRTDYLKTITFSYPLHIPSIVSILPSTWNKYREELEEIVLQHKLLFPTFRKGIINFDNIFTFRKGQTFIDEWGCVWKFSVDGLQGIVVKNPLENWDALERLKPPSIEIGLPREADTPIPWDAYEDFIERVKRAGGLTVGMMPHGFLFLRLSYLRGYVNLLKDIYYESSKLEKLIDILTNYNLSLVKRLIKLKVDIISFGDDLGTQDRLPFSPQKFRKILLPAYKKIFDEVKKNHILIRFHSDGYIIDIVEDLIAAGVNVVNLQDRVNGIEKIKEKIKEKAAIELDIDRQYLLPFGTPQEIRSHIKNAILTLGLKRGGLLFSAEISQDVPLSNIKALFDALEENANLHLTLE